MNETPFLMQLIMSPISWVIAEMGSFRWQCASRAESLNNDDLVYWLKQSGCHTVWTGIESLSESSLERTNKNTTPEKMLSGVAMADSYGLETMCQFIVGIPGDTIQDVQLTAKRITQSKIKRRGSNILWILPNTKAHEIALENGFDNNVYLTEGAPFYTYEQSMKTLREWSRML